MQWSAKIPQGSDLILLFPAGFGGYQGNKIEKLKLG